MMRKNMDDKRDCKPSIILLMRPKYYQSSFYLEFINVFQSLFQDAYSLHVLVQRKEGREMIALLPVSIRMCNYNVQIPTRSFATSI